MYKMAVMGDREAILAFKAIGIETVATSDISEAKHELKRMAHEQYAVIYMTEQLAEGLEAEIERYADEPMPAIILIPGSGGSLGIGRSNVKKAVERAVGADIFA